MTFKHVAAFGVLLGLAACYPIGPNTVEDYDVVYTVLPDPTFDFADASRTTYFMPDTVIDLSDPKSSPNPVGNQKNLLAEIATNMNDLGYTRITDTTALGNVDYVVLASVARTNNYYYNWWSGWGYGGYWGYWGWGGCCYYPVATVSNIRTGTLIVEMIDAHQLKPENTEAPVVWMGLGDGLYQGSVSDINSRSTKALNQMFNQSPYLKR